MPGVSGAPAPGAPGSAQPGRWAQRLRALRAGLPEFPGPAVEGQLTRIAGLTLEAVGCSAAVGTRCSVLNPDGSAIEAEIVGFSGERLFLTPTGSIQGLVPGARVIPRDRVYRVAVDAGLLGRVLDGRGDPLDGRGEVKAAHHYPLQSEPLNPLQRAPIREPLDVGIRAINALLPVGRGQRLGLFAGSGVGKSVLLGMMTRYTQADVVVVGLIGERGREVKEFVEDILGEEGLARAVVVAAPADTSPLMRLHGAMLAHSIAEFFRDQGRQVLLLMDSLTRFAQAQREIALAIGELPATKGYPPSVFARLPQLVERAGNAAPGGGSISAFYTVLVEGDDQNDPIADAARAILDGHVVLSRAIAEAGHYPAIDVLASISRAMPAIASPEQIANANAFRRLHALYQANKDLISVGAYQSGANPELDLAVRLQPALQAFLNQDMRDARSLATSLGDLEALVQAMGAAPGGAEPPARP